MILYEMFEQPEEPTLIDALRDFLPIAIKHLKLKSLPKIHLQKQVNTIHVASFGGYNDDEQAVTLVINNRQPADILRTLAHELVHWGQGQDNKIDDGSWHDGSELENEANAVAGVIMRDFARQHPQYLSLPAVAIPNQLEEKRRKKKSKTRGYSGYYGYYWGGNDSGEGGDGGGESVQEAEESDPTKPIPFPKGTTLVNVSDVYDWYKLGMAVPNLAGADPRTFNKGVPHTVFAFGSEEEEHRMAPLLKRLGFTLHDIDTQDDYEKAIRASDVIEHLEKYVSENFADGKKPGRKGLAKRSGVNCKASVTQLRKVAKNSTGEKRRMAHWCANMKSGKK